MKNLITDLFNELLPLIPQVSELEGYDITTKTLPNGFIFQAVKKPVEKDNSELVKFVADFKKYVQETDDCIFEKACKMYSEKSDLSLTDLAKISEEANLDNEDVIKTHCNMFKNCVKLTVANFIKELQDKYNS